MFWVQSINVPGTRNTQNHCEYWNVPGVPGVLGLHARVFACAQRKTYTHARASELFPRVHTRNTQNTRNKPVFMRLPDVPGTRNTKQPTRNTKTMTKPLRQTMPTVAAWIDEMRAAFGADAINASIKAGMDGQPTFYAKENGIEVGTKAPEVPERTVSLSDIYLPPKNAAKAPQMHHAKGK